MANRDVTISLKISDDGSDAAFARMKARFEELGNVSDKAIKAINKDLAGKVSGAFAIGGEREYFESIRRLQPELKQLHQNIKDGAFDLTDYSRRMQLLSPITRKAIEDAERMGKALRDTGDEAAHGTNGLGKLLVSLNLLERSADMAIDKLRQSFTNAIQFGREIASLDTILSKGADVSKFRDGILSLNPALGDSIELTKGLNLALGSGIAESEGLEFLRISAEAAKGGVASLTTTVDAGTTILAAYSMKTSEIGSVYDRLFQVVKDGKISMEQVGSSIGQVASIASLAGITLDEMFAAVATATLSGKPTESIEGLRTAIANIVKPSEQAIELSKSLGLEFNAQALQAQGLSKFLEEVTRKTGGSIEKMAVLFGDIQGLNIITKIAGENADAYAQRLANMGNAAGNSAQAFAKIQNDLGAQMDTFGVMLEKNFIGAFSKIAPILNFVLSVINKYPAPFAIAVTAVTALSLAHLAYNTQLIMSATVAIPNFLKSLQMIIGLMMSFSQVTSMSATALTAFSLGWIGIAAIIGIAVYAMIDWESAIDKANKTTLESINATAQSLASYQELAQQARAVAEAQEGSTDRHERLNAVIGKLEPATQAYINALGDEKDKVKAVTEEIQGNLDVRKATLEAALRTTAEAILLAKNQKEAETQRVQSLNDSIDVLNKQRQSMEAGIGSASEFGRSASEIKSDITSMSQSVLDGNNNISEFTKSLGENEIKLIQSARGLGLTTAQLQEFFRNLGYTDDKIQVLTAAYQNALDPQKNLTTEINNGADAATRAAGETNRLAESIANLKKQASARSGMLSDAVLEASAYAKNAAEAKANYKQLLETRPELKAAYEDEKRIKANMAGIEGRYSTSSSSGTNRSRSSSIRNGISEILPDSGEGFTTYRGRNANYGTQATIANLQTFAANWAEISKIPLQIGDIAKSGGGAIKGHKAHRDGNQADFRLVRRDGRMLPTNINDPSYDRETTRKQIEVLRQTIPGVKILFNDPVLIKAGLTQYAAGHDDHYHANRLGGSAYGGDNFRGRFESDATEADNKLYLKENMERMRAFYGAAKTLNVPDAVVRQYTDYLNKDIKRDRDKVDPSQVRDKYFARTDAEVSSAPADIARTLKLRKDLDEQHISDLRVSLGLEKGANGEKDRYQKLIERERNIMSEVEVLLEDQSVARREALVQAEVDYQLLKNRNIAEEANVALYQERNDRTRELGDIEIRLINLRRTNADDQAREQRQLLLQKKEEESLEFSISDLRDRIALADSGINNSLKVQEAYLSDILEIKNRDLEATIEINRATLELSQANVFSSTQVKGRVLSEISRSVGTINDSLADGIISAFEKGVDYLDKRLGKLGEIPIIGDLLKFQNRQTMANLTTGLMDAILPDNPFTAAFKESQLTISDKIGKSNTYLKRIADATAPTSPIGTVSSGGFGGGFVQPQRGGGIIGTLLGSILGVNRTGNLPVNYNNGTVFSNSGRSVLMDSGAVFSSGNGGGSLWGNIKNIFSTKDGGLFAARNNVLTGKTSRMGGIMGGIGDIATMIAPLLGGGKLSSVVGMAGTGASIGSMFGPWGAAAGAAIGGLVGLFTGGTRKQDEQTRTQAYLAVSAEFDKMIEALNSRPPTLQASVARSQADQIIAQYNAAMNQLKDSKTRRIALAEVTNNTGVIYRKNQQLEEAMKNALKWQVDDANRQKVSSSFTGEFAGGVYMDSSFRAQYDEFKRVNGMMPGTYTGRDYIKAIIGDGEMVLNAVQQMRVIANARSGYDNPFVDAGIPNVTKFNTPEPPRFAGGASFSAVTAPTSGNQNKKSEPDIINIDIDMRDLLDDLKRQIRAEMSSPTGKRITLGHVKARFNGSSND